MQNHVCRVSNLVFYAQSTIAVISGRFVCRDYSKCIHAHKQAPEHTDYIYIQLNLHTTWNLQQRLEMQFWGFCFVLRVDLNESREGLCQRGRGRSFHVEGLKYRKGTGTNSGELDRSDIATADGWVWYSLDPSLHQPPPPYPYPPPPTSPHPFINIPGGWGGENLLPTLAAITDKCKMIRPVWFFSISMQNSFVVNATWRQGSSYISYNRLDCITYVSASRLRAVSPWAPYWMPHLEAR